MKNRVSIALIVGLLFVGHSGLLFGMKKKESLDRKMFNLERAVEKAVHYGEKEDIANVKKYIKELGIERDDLIFGTPLQGCFSYWVDFLHDTPHSEIIEWLINKGANIKVSSQRDPSKTLLDQVIGGLYVLVMAKTGPFGLDKLDRERNLRVFIEGLKLAGLLIAKGLKLSKQNIKNLKIIKERVFKTHSKEAVKANQILDIYLGIWHIKSPYIGKKKEIVFEEISQKSKKRHKLYKKLEEALKKKIDQIQDKIDPMEGYYEKIVSPYYSNYASFITYLRLYVRKGKEMPKDEYNQRLQESVDEIVKSGKFLTHPHARTITKLKITLKPRKKIEKEIKKLIQLHKDKFELENKIEELKK